MREIKFRGKRADNGKWWFGSLVISYSGAHTVIGAKHGAYEVEPATVGQYTGLKDSNGVEIYEGDLIEFTMSDKKRVCAVEYRNGAFIVESDGFFGIGEFDLTAIGWALDEMDAAAVIGNIHDNPKLINP